MTTPSILSLGAEAILSRYPKRGTLADGRSVELRLMDAGDREAVLTFARAIPPNDLLFLPATITEPAAVDAWIAAIEAGRTTTVLAFVDNRLVGEGTLLHNATTWTRHLGEIRLLITPERQGQGLGRLLAGEIEAIAQTLGLRILTARMTLDQAAAQAVFRRLGFQREAVLFDYVIDAEGRTRDLLVATKHL